MKRKVFVVIALAVIFLAGAGLGFYIRSATLNPRATIPGVLERFLNFLVRQGEKEDDDLLYHDADLADFIVSGSTKTKVAVEGIVDAISHEPDGDYHVIIRPQYVPVGLSLVTEFIPEIKLPLPKKGDQIKIWGITRFDEPHNWWELHPVIGWEKL